MKTLQKVSGLFVAALMVVTAVQAGSSVNGAPGRSDFNKRKSMQPAKFAKPSKAVSTPNVEAVSSTKNSVAANGASASARSTDVVDQKIVTPVALSQPNAEVAGDTGSVVVPVTRLDSTSPVSAPAAVVATPQSTQKISYADVLTDRQKTVLKARAKDLKLKEDDYDNLLAPDEKERLDEMVRERMSAMASGE